MVEDLVSRHNLTVDQESPMTISFLFFLMVVAILSLQR